MFWSLSLKILLVWAFSVLGKTSGPNLSANNFLGELCINYLSLPASACN